MCKMLLFISVVMIVVGSVSALLLKPGPFEVSLTWTRCTSLTDSLAVRQERAVFWRGKHDSRVVRVHVREDLGHVSNCTL